MYSVLILHHMQNVTVATLVVLFGEVSYTWKFSYFALTCIKKLIYLEQRDLYI